MVAVAGLLLGAHAANLSDLARSEPAPLIRPFKQAGSQTLRLHIFPPKLAKPGDRRPAVIWIHGGGWKGGTPSLFYPHARYTALRGSVGIAIEYRLIRHGGPTVADCVSDCKSAVRYVRSHAAELGIDLDRVVVAGDSSGGHLALAVATLPGFDDPADSTSASAIPNAVAAYNPITDLTEGWMLNTVASAAVARSLSPVFYVRAKLPPMIVLHGLEDTVVPVGQSKRFVEAMKAAGNRCDLALYPKTGHAFVIPNYTAPEKTVVEAIRAFDRFMVSLGYWQGEPALTF